MTPFVGLSIVQSSQGTESIVSKDSGHLKTQGLKSIEESPVLRFQYFAYLGLIDCVQISNVCVNPRSECSQYL